MNIHGPKAHSLPSICAGQEEEPQKGTRIAGLKANFVPRVRQYWGQELVDFQQLSRVYFAGQVRLLKQAGNGSW